MIESILGGHPHLSLRKNYLGYTLLSNGHRVGYINTSKQTDCEWSNFSLDPLPCVVNTKMKRVDFLNLIEWLNTFSKWTVEIVPGTLEDDIFEVEIEYNIGFPSEKDCAIFYLYKDEQIIS